MLCTVTVLEGGGGGGGARGGGGGGGLRVKDGSKSRRGGGGRTGEGSQRGGAGTEAPPGGFDFTPSAPLLLLLHLLPHSLPKASHGEYHFISAPTSQPTAVVQASAAPPPAPPTPPTSPDLPPLSAASVCVVCVCVLHPGWSKIRPLLNGAALTHY